MIGQNGRHQRLLAIQAPALCLPMSTMGIDDMILGDVSKPEAKRHHRVAEVFLQTTMGFEKDILDDVAGIDARRQRGIKAEIDHPSQRLTMDIEKTINGTSLPLAGAGEQVLRIGVVAPHAPPSG
jgi:hypothetical protein